MATPISKGLLFKSNDKYKNITLTKQRKNIRMTANNAPSSLVASASGSQTNHPPYTAFDGITTGSSLGWSVASYSGWLQIDFGEKTNICGFTLYSGKNGGYYLHASAPNNFKLIGSYDGVNWNDINSYTASWGSSNANIISKYFECNNSNYKYYRLVVNSVTSGYVFVGAMFFEEFEVKLNEYPMSDNNLLKSTSDFVLFNQLFDNKNYILQDEVSEISEGLWSTKLDRKPLSIGFN